MKFIQDITKFIFVENLPVEVDVIFIPGTSVPYPAERAAKIFNSGLAKYIIPTGKYSSKLGRFPTERTFDTKYKGNYKTECEFFIEILKKNGVPDDAIIKEDMSQNTYDNALKAKQLTTNLNIEVNKAIVCCQAYHARRVFMTYSLFYPETEILICPVNTRGINKENWYTFEYGIKRVMGELERCGKYFLDAISNITIES